MLRIKILLLTSVLIASCSTTQSPDSSGADTCTLKLNTEKRISMLVDGFGKKNLLIDFDIRVHQPPYDTSDHAMTFEQLIFADSSYYYEAVSGIIDPVIVGDDGELVVLAVRLPSFHPGTYSWTGTSKAGRNGVVFNLSRQDSSKGVYRPVSGKTMIDYQKKTAFGKPDSLYGSFCGTLQNAVGDKITVHEGKFYLIFP